MLMRSGRLRCATSLQSIALLAGLVGTGLRLGALEVRRDGFRLRAATPRTAATSLVAIARCLGAPLGAVGHRTLGALFRLLTHGRLAARLGDGIGDRLGDQLDRTDCIVVTGNRH